MTRNEQNAAKTNAVMKAQTFGIEIETHGVGREALATKIADEMGEGWTTTRDGGYYDVTAVVMPDGRKWKVMFDGSLPNGGGAEVVSPILKWGDIETMQDVVRAIKKSGARIDSSTGMHVHVGADDMTVKDVRNLIKIVHRREELIEQSINMNSRRQRWAQSVDGERLRRIERVGNGSSLRALNRAWYGSFTPRPTHYDNSRYHGLNLHNLWFLGTVEFRWFDATTHAGKAKAYVQFCMAVVASAKMQRSASSARQVSGDTRARTMQAWMCAQLGLIGDEFKTVRKHMTDNLKAADSARPRRAADALDAALGTATAGPDDDGLVTMTI